MTMSQRIRQLEDALEIAKNQDMAWGTHPLLSDDLLAIKFGPESRTNGELSTDPHEDGSETDHSISTPGSFFKSHDGSTTYFGPSGGSGESLYPAALDPYCLRRNQETVLPVCPSTPTGSGQIAKTSLRLEMNLLLTMWVVWHHMWRTAASLSSLMATTIKIGCTF